MQNGIALAREAQTSIYTALTNDTCAGIINEG